MSSKEADETRERSDELDEQPEAVLNRILENPNVPDWVKSDLRSLCSEFISE